MLTKQFRKWRTNCDAGGNGGDVDDVDDYDEDDDDGDVDDKHLFHKKPLLFLLLNHCKPEKK